MSSETASVVLAEHGRPVAKIAPRRGASDAEQYAAEELRTHLNLLAGAKRAAYQRLPADAATIRLNDRDAAEAAGVDVEALKLAPESFYLATRAGDVHVLGGSARGLLYGVYELLERLGVRWFTPELTHVPARKRVELASVECTQAPAFEFRDQLFWEGGDAAWWVRNRLNGHYTPVPDYMGGHEAYGLFVHTFFRLVPPERHFVQHPEYYSLINGVRRHEGGQLCLTNPAVLDIATDSVLAAMRENPKARLFSVSQMDWEGWCQCPACTAVAEEEGSQSAPVLRFVNALAERTAKVFPDKLISTLAYWYTLDAPRRTSPGPNVRVRLCPIRCCQGHAFGQCDHPESRRFLRAIEGWGRLTPQMYIWHYATNFAHYPLAMPNLDELAANIAFYRRLGVHGVFVQGMGGDGGGAESMPLRGYVLSKLLWDPSRPAWPVADEFLADYYGPAAGGVRRYLDLFHARVREDRSCHPSLYDPPSHPLFDGDILARADAALADGEAKARGQQRRNVRLLRGGIAYARVSRKAGSGFRREGDIYRGPADDADRKDFDTLVRDRKAYGAECLREGYPIDQTARLIRSRLMEHKVAWLRAGEAALAVVPSLGGRILEWHVGGRQWLAPADPDSPWNPYPLSGGYCEYVRPGEYLFVGFGEPYRCRQEGDALRLSARPYEDVSLTRVCSIDVASLRIVSRLTNRGDKPLSIGWGGGLDWLAPDWQRLRYLSAGGDEKTLASGEIAAGYANVKTLTAADLPAGAWSIDLPGWRIEHRFEIAGVEQAHFAVVNGGQTLSTGVRTGALDLAPRRGIEFRQELSVRSERDSLK